MSRNLTIALIVVVIVGFVSAIFIFSNNSSKQANNQVASSVESLDPNSRYVEYDSKRFEDEKGKKRVYFFHAVWCPTCKAANKEFLSNLNSIPEDVVLFRTDYDTQTELKKKYNITYQHTFVYVDENGEEIKKWNGGGLYELTSNTR